MFLSKSDFLKYQACPSYLWLWKFRKDVVPEDDDEATRNRRFEQGNEIEAYARELFPGGALVDSYGEAAQSLTQKYVEAGEKVIFQATVITDSGLLAMADIIEFDEESQDWVLHEVKSTNTVKKEHIYDVTFQKAAFEEAGYSIGRTSVIHTSKEYVRQGSINANKLLTKEDVSDRVDEVLPEIKQQIQDALDILKKDEEPKGCNCRLKARSGHCPTFQYLNNDVPEYSVFNISRLRGKKLENLVDNEVLEVKDVPDDIKLSNIQANQVSVAKSNTPLIDKDKIKSILEELDFPLYFLDYETVSTAIPLYSETIPFQQIPFQHSLHSLSSPNGELGHGEYLAREARNDNILELIKSLQAQILDGGTVVVWNRSFEAKRNEEMAEMYPEYKEFLLSVNDRIFDLMEIFSKQLYVHPDFYGSSSIKAVLPVLVPKLSYEDLGIQNGALASVKWYEAVASDIDEVNKQKIFNELLEYCKLDTLAMVEIWKVLQELTVAQ